MKTIGKSVKAQSLRTPIRGFDFGFSEDDGSFFAVDAPVDVGGPKDDETDLDTDVAFPGLAFELVGAALRSRAAEEPSADETLFARTFSFPFRL
jgi:hypothetical protein